MASGVNIKMGVSGVAQFKGEINKVKQSLKTVDEALKLNEKEFKATGDAQAYMQTKTELLQVKLEEQKSILQTAEKALQDMTEKGVDKASAAFQDMQRQVLQAKGAMLDTENQLNNIGVESADAAAGVEDMNKNLKEVGKGVSWQNVTEGLHTINEGISKTLKKVWQLGEDIVRATLGAGSWADELKTTAAQMSTAEHTVTPEELQRMRKTAQLIDTDVDTIVSARSKLYKDLAKGDKSTVAGLVMTDGKSSEDIFWETGKAIMAMTDNVEQEEAAQKAFGKSWKELIPLFQAGREEYEKTMASWSVVDDEKIDNLGKMDDQYQKLNGEWETFKMELLGTFAGPLEEGMAKLTEFVKSLNEYLSTPEGKAMLEQMGKTITDLITQLVNVNPEDIVNGLASVVDGITNAFKWIDENAETVKGALVVIAGGIAALKLAEAAANIGKLVSGFKTLWNGSGNPMPSVPGAPTGGSPTTTGGGGGGGGWFAGLAGSIKGTIASNGLSLLTPAAVLALAVAPAEAARKADEARWREQQERWSAAGEKLSGGDKAFVVAAAKTMEDVYRPTGDPYKYLMELQNRSDLQMMQLHNMVGSDTWTSLMEFWRTGGENMADFQVTQLFQDVADAYSRMAEQTEDVTGASEAQTKSNDKMTAAAEKLNTTAANLPRWLGESMKNMTVQMDGEVVGRVVSDYVDEALAENLV